MLLQQPPGRARDALTHSASRVFFRGAGGQLLKQLLLHRVCTTCRGEIRPHAAHTWYSRPRRARWVSEAYLVPRAHETGSLRLKCNTVVHDTQTGPDWDNCRHNPISFCSPSHQTAATQTDLSQTQILVLLLLLRGQEKSLAPLGALEGICTS